MRLLITGSHGQVGSELTRQAIDSGLEVKAVGRNELDVTDINAVNLLVRTFRPDVVINAAAYTAVDRAEDEPRLAFSVNRDGPENLSKVCAELDILLIHYSTDYVFDGSKTEPYFESDSVSPLGVYGESKFEGESAVALNCSKHLIIRTSWVFSAHGNNFVKTMLRLSSEREYLGVVADQLGKPTSAAEIARLTLEILPKADGHWGVFHLAQPEVVSWFDFSHIIFDAAREQGIKLVVKNIKAIGTADYPTPAMRPLNSELDCSALERAFNVSIRPWRKSLVEVIKELSHV